MKDFVPIKTYCFIEYATHDEMINAIAQNKNLKLDGVELLVEEKKSQKKSKNNNNRKPYSPGGNKKYNNYNKRKNGKT